MKKALALLLALTMCLSLTACGGTAEPEATVPATVPVETAIPSVPVVTEAPTEATEPIPVATIEETVVFEENGVKITATDLDFSRSPKVNFVVENNSGKEILIQGYNASVNGYMVNCNFYAEPENNTEEEATLEFYLDELELYGIADIAKIEFYFEVLELVEVTTHDDGSTSSHYETFLISPIIQLNTSIAEPQPASFDDSGEVVYDSEIAKVVVKGTSQDERMGSCIDFYVENNSDTMFTITTDDGRNGGDGKESVNDSRYYGSMGYFNVVFPGSKALAKMGFSQDMQWITEEIHNAEFSLEFYTIETPDSYPEFIAGTDIINLSF